MSKLFLKVVEPKKKYVLASPSMRRRSESGRIMRSKVDSAEKQICDEYLHIVANALYFEESASQITEENIRGLYRRCFGAR